MKIQMQSSWTKKLKRQVEKYEMEVGILDDKPHMAPLDTPIGTPPKLGSYAGGPVRRSTRVPDGKSIGEILVENMERTQTNYLLEPFRKKSSDIMKFTTYFLKYIVGGLGAAPKRVENLVQAIVRNPILKQEYGNNTSTTADNKGFDRHLIDTGQTFKQIKARIIKRGGG